MKRNLQNLVDNHGDLAYLSAGYFLHNALDPIPLQERLGFLGELISTTAFGNEFLTTKISYLRILQETEEPLAINNQQRVFSPTGCSGSLEINLAQSRAAKLSSSLAAMNDNYDGRGKKMDKNVRKIRKASFGRLLKQVVIRIESEMTRRLADAGLTVKTFGIIMILLEEEGLSQIELGTRSEVPGYATTRVLDDLEQQGLIERRPHPTSRRANLIFLTEKGQELRDRVPMIVKEVNNAFLEPCNHEERKVLMDVLGKIVDNNPLD